MKDVLPYQTLRKLEDLDAQGHKAATFKRAKIYNWGDEGVTHISDLGYFSIRAGLNEYNESFGKTEDILANIHRRMENESLPSILDVGCGTGQFARDVASAFEGFPSAPKISEISLGDGREQTEIEEDERLGITFIDGDIQTTRFASQTFDLIYARMSIVHLIDPIRIIKKLYQALKVNGEMFISFDRTQFEKLFFTERHRENPNGSSFWNDPSLKEKIIQTVKSDVDRLLETFSSNPDIVFSLSKDVLYIKKLKHGQLHLGPLGYSSAVEEGYVANGEILTEGVYKWKDPIPHVLEDGKNYSKNQLVRIISWLRQRVLARSR